MLERWCCCAIHAASLCAVYYLIYLLRPILSSHPHCQYPTPGVLLEALLPACQCFCLSKPPLSCHLLLPQVKHAYHDDLTGHPSLALAGLLKALSPYTGLPILSCPSSKVSRYLPSNLEPISVNQKWLLCSLFHSSIFPKLIVPFLFILPLSQLDLLLHWPLLLPFVHVAALLLHGCLNQDGKYPGLQLLPMIPL
jgi:hypothetical protein